MKRMTLKCRPAFWLCLLTASAFLMGNSDFLEVAQSSEKAEPKTVVTNLDNPSGVAVHPQTGHVFVAAHPVIYRYVPGAPGKVYLEVTGFSTDVYGKGPKYNIGPLGVSFLDNNHLVVGDGGKEDPKELVRVYQVGDQPLSKPQNEDDAVHTLGPLPKSDKTESGEGNFYGVAANDSAIFVTCNGDDTKGWVAKSVVKDGKPGPLKLSIATKVATEVDAPVPAIYTPDQKQLVIGQMGEINLPGDSLLTFYDPKTGELKKKFKTGLNDITGLAYSPKTGSLYATDFSWMAPDKGGLFRLNIKGDQVEAEKIYSLDKPTALAFDEGGRLYVAVFGTADEEEKEDQLPGKILLIDADL